jgi:hypothetical protein
MIALVAVLSAVVVDADPRYSEAWHQSVPLTAGGEVEIDDQYGDVTVTAGAPGTVQIDAVKRADSKGDLAAINVHVDRIEGAVKIVTDYPSQWRGLHRVQRWVDYRIAVPRGTKLILRQKYGEGRIVEVGGPVDAQTRYGDIAVTGEVGEAIVSTVYGDVSLSAARTGPNEHVSMRTTYGDVNVELPHGSKPHVDAVTRVGSISNDFKTDTGPGPRLDLKTTFGDVTVREEAGQ